MRQSTWKKVIWIGQPYKSCGGDRQAETFSVDYRPEWEDGAYPDPKDHISEQPLTDVPASNWPEPLPSTDYFSERAETDAEPEEQNRTTRPRSTVEYRVP